MRREHPQLKQSVKGKENTLHRFHIKHAFRRYFAIVFPLLIVAAAIETFIILRPL